MKINYKKAKGNMMMEPSGFDLRQRGKLCRLKGFPGTDGSTASSGMQLIPAGALFTVIFNEVTVFIA